MANSKYAYVKSFEVEERILPEVWIVVRLDGRCFSRFAEEHRLQKPNDERCLRLMEHSARKVLESFDDCFLAYGQSDEFSFVLRKQTNIFNRRKSKILSCVVSLFSSSFVFHWKTFFEDTELQYPPTFDGRVVVYPSEQTLRDYLSWRQVDCHINNQYNTCFWLLVQNGATPKEAYETLKGTLSDFKNELLFQKFGINYAHLEARFRKGSTLFKKAREDSLHSSKTTGYEIILTHEDIIHDVFWDQHRELLDSSVGRKKSR